MIGNWISIPLRAAFIDLISSYRLVSVDQAEMAKRRREESRNLLETYLYRLRDLLDGDSSSPFIVYSKQAERTELSNSLQETFQWLSESGDSADSIELWSKREALE